MHPPKKNKNKTTTNKQNNKKKLSMGPPQMTSIDITAEPIITQLILQVSTAVAPVRTQHRLNLGSLCITCSQTTLDTPAANDQDNPFQRSKFVSLWTGSHTSEQYPSEIQLPSLSRVKSYRIKVLQVAVGGLFVHERFNERSTSQVKGDRNNTWWSACESIFGVRPILNSFRISTASTKSSKQAKTSLSGHISSSRLRAGCNPMFVSSWNITDVKDVKKESQPLCLRSVSPHRKINETVNSAQWDTHVHQY